MSGAAKPNAAVYCETCRLSYASQSELQEHLWSLMHHVKLEKKEKLTEHVCCLCETSSSNLVKYGQHLNELRHKQALAKLKEKKIAVIPKPSSPLDAPITPSLMPNKSWHLNNPFSHLRPYVSPLCSRKHLPNWNPKQNLGTETQTQQEANVNRNATICNEGTVSNENNTKTGQSDQNGPLPEQLMKDKPVVQNSDFNYKRKFAPKKKKKKKLKLDVPKDASVNMCAESASENVCTKSSSYPQKELLKNNSQTVSTYNSTATNSQTVSSSNSTANSSSSSSSTANSKKKMIFTTPTGFRQGLFIEEDLKKSNINFARLNLINATNDKADKIFPNKQLPCFMKDNKNISQHSTSHLHMNNYRPARPVPIINKYLRFPNSPKNQSNFPERLNDSSKKDIPFKVSNPSVKDSKSTAETKLTVSSSEKSIKDNSSKTVLVQTESPLVPPSTKPEDKVNSNLLMAGSNSAETKKTSLNIPNTSSKPVESVKNCENAPISNSLSQNSINSNVKTKESNPQTKLPEVKSSSNSAGSKPRVTTEMSIAKKRVLSPEHLVGSIKPNLVKKVKCSTSKEINTPESVAKTGDGVSSSSTVLDRSNRPSEPSSSKPDSTVEKQQQLGKNVGKEELVKMTKLSCLNHKEKMHLSSVMKSYTKTQTRRSAVPRLSMQLSAVSKPCIQGDNSENINLPEGLEDQITMLIKKENLEENTDSSSSDLTDRGQTNLQMDRLQIPVPDTPSSAPSPSVGSTANLKSSISAGSKTKDKVNATVKLKHNTSQQLTAGVPTPTTAANTTISMSTAATTTTTTTTKTGSVSGSESQPGTELYQTAKDAVQDAGEMPAAADVIHRVYLLTLQEEEVCSNISKLNNEISDWEKSIEDAKAALQACKEQQQNLLEEEKKIRKMRIGMLKEAMGDTNRSNRELIQQLMGSHLSNETPSPNSSKAVFSLTPIDRPSSSQQQQYDDDYEQDQKIPLEILQSQLMQLRQDEDNVRHRPGTVSTTTHVPSMTQKKQPVLANLLAKGNEPVPQRRQPHQKGSLPEETAAPIVSAIQSSEKPHQSESGLQKKKPLKDISRSDYVKSLKVPRSLIDSFDPIFGHQNPADNSQSTFSQVSTNCHPSNVDKTCQRTEPSSFQYGEESTLSASTKETNNLSNSSNMQCFSLPSQEHSELKSPFLSSSSSSPPMETSNSFNSYDRVSVPSNNNNNGEKAGFLHEEASKRKERPKELADSKEGIILQKVVSEGSSELNANHVSEESMVPSIFDNIQIKTEPISPNTNNPETPIFNFTSIKQEPKSPSELVAPELGGYKFGEPEYTFSFQLDNPKNEPCNTEEQLQENLPDAASSQQNNNLEPSQSEQVTDNNISSPGNSNRFIDDRLLADTETSNSSCVQQNSPPQSPQSSCVTSSHSMVSSSLPTESNDKKDSSEEFEFFSSLSVKNLLDSSQIEGLPKNIAESAESSTKVSMKYLGSVSNNLVEQLKECWKKQNVTMNKCFPQGENHGAATTTTNDVPLTSSCDKTTSLSQMAPPACISPVYVNLEPSNKFVLPASLNPVVSIEPLKCDVSRSKFMKTAGGKAGLKYSKVNSNCITISSSEESSDKESPFRSIVIDDTSSSDDSDIISQLYPSTIPRLTSKTGTNPVTSTENLDNECDVNPPSTKMVYKGPNCPVTNCTVYNNYLYVSYQGHSPQKFDLNTGLCVRQYECHPFSVQCMLVTEIPVKRPCVFSGGASETVLAFDEITGELITKVDLMGKIYTFHEKWNFLFVGLAEGGVSKLNLKTLKEVSNISYGSKPIHCLATCTEGALRILCVGAYDASILVVDASSGLLLKTLTPCQRLLYSIKIYQNLIYSCSEDRKLAIYDIESGRLLKCIQHHSGTISSLYVNNKILLTGSHDKLINIYWGSIEDLESKIPLSFYGAGKESISCLTFSDGKIFTGNFYGIIETVELPSELTKKWQCKYKTCSLVFGLQEDLRYHIHNEHLKGQIAVHNVWQCQWRYCTEKFTSLTLLTTHCDKHTNQ
ncbi:bromodomain-containing protein DDB_G0270170-like [Argonauta hians]